MPENPPGNYIGNNLAQRTKETVIRELRDYFQNTSQFGFPGPDGSEPVIKTPIIREAYGYNIRQYPLIVVKILHEETRNLGIGRDFVEDVVSDDQRVYEEYLPGTENFTEPVPYKRRVIAERYGYMSDIFFNLQVWGDTTQVRNQTVDEVIGALRTWRRESFLNQGIQILKLSTGEETDYPLDNHQKIYISNINFEVNAELYYDIKVGSITKVNAYRRIAPVNLSPDQPKFIDQSDKDGNLPTYLGKPISFHFQRPRRYRK